MNASAIAPRNGPARRSRPSRSNAWIDWSPVAVTAELEAADVMSLRLEDRSKRRIHGYSFELNPGRRTESRPVDLDVLPRDPGNAGGRVHANVADVRPCAGWRMQEHPVVDGAAGEGVLEVPRVAGRC